MGIVTLINNQITLWLSTKCNYKTRKMTIASSPIGPRQQRLIQHVTKLPPRNRPFQWSSWWAKGGDCHFVQWKRGFLTGAFNCWLATLSSLWMAVRFYLIPCSPPRPFGTNHSYEIITHSYEIITPQISLYSPCYVCFFLGCDTWGLWRAYKSLSFI